MGRTLIIAGAVLVLAGLLWPWLSSVSFGRLPGDVVIERGDLRFYFPITTCIVVSVAASVIWWVLR